MTLYEPPELCLRAGGGTPVREIVDLLAQRGPELAVASVDNAGAINMAMAQS